MKEKEKIAELKQKRRQMQEELDELEGNTVKGKIICTAIFLLTIAISFGVLAGMVKLNVGGVAGDIFAPYISDVPVLRSILPADMQKKSAAELAQAEADAQAAVEAQAAAEAQAAVEAQAVADAQAAADAKAQAEADAQAAENAKLQAEADAQAKAQADAEAQAALQDYADTYSAMQPTDAAKLFESMMPDQEELIVKILKALKPDQRAAILSKMSTENAGTLTTKMES